MSGFTCPFCGMIFAISHETLARQYPSFDKPKSVSMSINGPGVDESSIEVNFYRCPNCRQHTIFVVGIGSSVKDINAPIRPLSLARHYPDYIPQQIREDYEEACAILRSSAKASATLSRRCLQGMIRDYWGIVRENLYAEVSALKDSIAPDLWAAIDSLRQMGNIGAHMQKDTNIIVDIDPDEAALLIQLIELLMKEWYINREERKALLTGVVQVNQEKQIQRKGEG